MKLKLSQNLKNRIHQIVITFKLNLTHKNNPQGRPLKIDNEYALTLAPSNANYVRTRIVKNALHAPQNPTDGVIVYEGTLPFFRDLFSKTTASQQNFFYAFFTFDRNLNFSIPILAPISPSVSLSIGVITKNLYRGLKHPEVSLLQAFLIAKGYLDSENATGFFGVLTEAAIQKYQCAKKIVCVGTPASTGYGAVGPRTRAQINQEGYTSGAIVASPSSDNQVLIQQIKAKILELQEKIRQLRGK